MEPPSDGDGKMNCNHSKLRPRRVGIGFSLESGRAEKNDVLRSGVNIFWAIGSMISLSSCATGNARLPPGQPPDQAQRRWFPLRTCQGHPPRRSAPPGRWCSIAAQPPTPFSSRNAIRGTATCSWPAARWPSSPPASRSRFMAWWRSAPLRSWTKLRARPRWPISSSPARIFRPPAIRRRIIWCRCCVNFSKHAPPVPLDHLESSLTFADSSESEAPQQCAAENHRGHAARRAGLR